MLVGGKEHKGKEKKIKEREEKKKRKRERERRKEIEKRRKRKVGELFPHISGLPMGPRSKVRLRDEGYAPRGRDFPTLVYFHPKGLFLRYGNAALF